MSDAQSDAKLAQLRAEAEAAEAELKLARARAALAAAEAETEATTTDAAPDPQAVEPEVTVEDPSPTVEDPAPSVADPPLASPETTADQPLGDDAVAAIAAGYGFTGAALELGALVNGEARPDVQIRIPLAMTNRHGLVAGATGTGKTRTLQVLAEQFASHGVSVFAADIKGDLSGIAVPGDDSQKLRERTQGIGQDWQRKASTSEFFALGGVGNGIPVRATVSAFGPLLLSKVLGLNQTQESSLGLVFHYADREGLALVDLSDLRAVLTYLVSDDGKGELTDLGGLSVATVGVILRELITFADGGADVFFGEPEFDVTDFLRTAPDGSGIISLLEVPEVANRPELFSTFLMYLLAELFEILPEVGDLDKPKLVFFFDEAHLLFKNASKDFLAAITQTVRLIRSKGVGVFFVTQTPKDVPSDVLAQLGSRVQHALRAFTPDDAKALRATVGTYPVSDYNLERVLQELGTGEAIVTVMGERGAPTPVAWTRLRAPHGSMSPAPADVMSRLIEASPLLPKYRDAIDRESAREILGARLDAATAERDAAESKLERAKIDAEYAKQQAAIDKAQADAEKKAQKEYERLLKMTGGSTKTSRKPRAEKSPLEQILGSRSTQTILNGVIRGMFGTGRRS